MVTNFAHLKKWGRIYEDAIGMEDQLLKATTKFDYKTVIHSARTILEGMLIKMVKTAGITDQEILTVMRQAGRTETRPTILGRILTLNRAGILSQETFENFKDINKNGNGGSHAETKLDNLSLHEIKEVAERVYAKLYRESYLFAHQYIPMLEDRKGTGIKVPTAHKINWGTPQEWKIAGIVCGLAFVAIILLLTVGL